MLHTETVEPNTFDLLKRLMGDEQLTSFNLVGGTALSLQIGHRVSVDLDLFSSSPFSVEDLSFHLKNSYADFEPGRTNDFTLITEIEGIKVDFISYKYPLLNHIITDESIRLYNIDDISAMKLSAISNSGRRLKDFIDVACLSTKLSLNKMLENFEKKFDMPSMSLHVVRSIGYHKEIYHEEIHMVHCRYNWQLIQNRIFDMIDNPDKIFHSLPVD